MQESNDEQLEPKELEEFRKYCLLLGAGGMIPKAPILVSRRNLNKLRIAADQMKRQPGVFISYNYDNLLHNSSAPACGPLPEVPATRAEEKRAHPRSLFAILELFSHILPFRARVELFEPCYEDEKADYLRSRLKYRSKVARRWLVFCFALRVSIIAGQCFWKNCGSKLRKLFVILLPELLRRFLR